VSINSGKGQLEINNEDIKILHRMDEIYTDYHLKFLDEIPYCPEYIASLLPDENNQYNQIQISKFNHKPLKSNLQIQKIFFKNFLIKQINFKSNNQFQINQR